MGIIIKHRLQKIQEGKEPTQLLPEFTLRDGPSPSVREFLRLHENEVISNLEVCRKPIFGILRKILNILTLGHLQRQMKKLNYDQIMHLYLAFTVGNRRYRIDKNHVVEIVPYNDKCSDYKTVACQASNIKFGDFYNNGVQLLGVKNFYTYSAYQYNCQNFVYNLLKANGLATPELEKYIMQDATALIPSYLRGPSKWITNIAHKFDTLIYGKGKKKKNTRLVSHSTHEVGQRKDIVQNVIYV
jgi:hypothetical protein